MHMRRQFSEPSLRMEYQQRTLQTTSETPNRRIALTVPQITIWLDQSVHSQKPIYNTGQTLTFRAPLVIDRFLETLNRVVAENDALRARFIQSDDDVFQEIPKDVTVDLEYKDFSGERDPEAGARTWIERLFWKPIGSSDFPLFKFALAK